jgi:fluoride exporter
LLVGAGGAIGSILRYLLTGYVQRLTGNGGFPFGTLAVNLGGCLVVGILSYLADTRNLFTPESRAFVFIGLLGGFTTFSSFGSETAALMRDGGTWPGLANVGVHLVFGLGAVWAGRAMAAWVWK